jgi:Tfp pilus assembly protein PilN
VRPVNLIPGEHRLQATGSQSGSAYVVVGVLAVLVGMVGFYVLTSNSVKQKQADAVEAKAEADRLEARASSLGAFATFSQIKETRVASVRQVADTRFDWERMMRELSRVMPPGSWLREVDGSISGATGDTTTTQTGDQVGPPATKLIGCAPTHSDVARMMVRLRALHKVSDVRLQESTRQEKEGETDALEGCTDVEFDVTVTFGAAPSKEAPRASRGVPAALGGGQ